MVSSFPFLLRSPVLLSSASFGRIAAWLFRLVVFDVGSANESHVDCLCQTHVQVGGGAPTHLPFAFWGLGCWHKARCGVRGDRHVSVLLFEKDEGKHGGGHICCRLDHVRSFAVAAAILGGLHELHGTKVPNKERISR